MSIPIFHTHISNDAPDAVSAVLRTTMLSEGALVSRFEESLCKVLGIGNSVAVNSGTSALHLALALSGVGPGDEVILPAQTFIASGLTVMMTGAKPVFADINYSTGNLDPGSLRSKISGRTRAIMPVHWGGYPCDLDEIGAIAREFELTVIEDAAHALGATYHNIPIGKISDFTCFSFQAIKHVTTGDGGSISARDPNAVAEARRRRWFGIDRMGSAPSLLGERQHDVGEVGFKYHMNDYAAALGLANLNGFAERLARIRSTASRYRESLKSVPGITLFENSTDRQSAFWLFGIHVERREDFVLAMRANGITTSVVHQRIDRNSVFGGITEGLVNQVRFDETQIHIPCHSGLSDEMIEHVVRCIARGW